MKKALSLLLVLTIVFGSVYDLSATELEVTVQSTTEEAVTEETVTEETTTEETVTEEAVAEETVTEETVTEETVTEETVTEETVTEETEEVEVADAEIRVVTKDGDEGYANFYYDTDKKGANIEDLFNAILSGNESIDQKIVAYDHDGTDLSSEISLKSFIIDENDSDKPYSKDKLITANYDAVFAVTGENGREVTFDASVYVSVGEWAEGMYNAYGDMNEGGFEVLSYDDGVFGLDTMVTDSFEYGQALDKPYFDGIYTVDAEDGTIMLDEVYVTYLGADIVGLNEDIISFEGEMNLPEGEYFKGTVPQFNRKFEFKGDGTDLPGLYYFYVRARNSEIPTTKVESRKYDSDYNPSGKSAWVVIEVKNFDGTSSNDTIQEVRRSGKTLTSAETAKLLGDYLSTSEVEKYKSGDLSPTEMVALVNTRTPEYTGTTVGTNTETIDPTVTETQKLNETGYSPVLGMLFVTVIGMLFAAKKSLK